MKSLVLSNATRIMAKDQPEYNDLHIHDHAIDGVNHMVSMWKPSAGELRALKRGGAVTLHILGSTHPPVMLGVLLDGKHIK